MRKDTFNYCYMREQIERLNGVYKWGNVALTEMFKRQKQLFTIMRSGVNTFNTKFAVFQTKEYGKTLVQLNFIDLPDGQFELRCQFDNFNLGCSPVIARRVTDERLKDYLARNRQYLQEVVSKATITTKNF